MKTRMMIIGLLLVCVGFAVTDGAIDKAADMLNDFVDYRQVPIQNAELLQLMDDAGVIRGRLLFGV